MAIKKEIIIDINTDEANQKLKEVDKNIKQTSKDAGESFGIMDTQIGGMAKGFLDFGKKAITTMKTLKGAIAATGIGLLVIAIAGLVDWMKSSEKGSQVLAITMKVLGQVIKEGPIIAFNLLKLAVQYLMLPFKTLMIVMKNAKDVLTGKQSVREAMENTKNETIALGKEMVETAKKIGESFVKIGKGAVDAAKLENDFIKAKRKNLEEEARLNRELAATKLVMDDATKTDIERLNELNKASKIQQEITRNKIALAKQELAIIESNIALGDSSIENLDKQAEAKANLIQLEAEGFDRLKEFADKRTAIEQATIEKQKAADEARRAERIKDIQDEKKFLDEINALLDADFDADMLKEEQRLLKIQAIQDSFKQKNEDAAAQTELDRIMLQQSRDLAALEALNATEAQKYEVKKYYLDLIAKDEKQKAKEQKDLDKAVMMAKINIAGQTAELLSMMLNQDSKAYKALQIAQIAASGIQAVQSAFTTGLASPITTVFPAYPYIQAGLAGAFSAVQLAKIKSSGNGNQGNGSSNYSGGSGGYNNQTPPQFNIVQGTAGNQIAEGLNSNKNVIKAYVVGSEVSSQQELDRKIVTTASI